MIENFKNRAFKGAAFVVLGYGLSQGFRLGGNLLLTRLLVPEFFGILALAHVFYIGLHLFSDIGLEPGIIRSSRGNEATFLNTAWTLQIIRGLILWCFSLIIAWPVAKFYQEPALALIIPIIGLDAIFSGFQSTSLITLNKELKLGKLTLIELSVEFVGLICMIAIAYTYKNIWSLVFGGLIASVLKTVWSHFVDSRIRNRFVLDKTAVTELFTFGKWIFISTAMMFLATQSDRLLLGKIFPIALFGVYGIAVIFSELPKQIINHVGYRVIFPVISHFSHLPRSELRLKILSKRKLLLIPLALLVALMVCFGDLLIDFLYDERYQQAGWMLPLLSLGIWPLILYATVDRSLYVVNKPKYSAIGNLLKFLYMIICLPFFYIIVGKFGAVLAVATNDLPVYLVVNYGLMREGLSGLMQDAWATLILFGLICLLLVFRFYTGMGFPGVSMFFS